MNRYDQARYEQAAWRAAAEAMQFRAEAARSARDPYLLRLYECERWRKAAMCAEDAFLLGAARTANEQAKAALTQAEAHR